MKQAIVSEPDHFVATEKDGGLRLGKRKGPPTQTTTHGELSYRVWANCRSYDEEPLPWRCCAAFGYLTEALDYIAYCQDRGCDVVFQSPAEVKFIAASATRVVALCIGKVGSKV